MKRVMTLDKNGEEIITISMEEYRELLIIKGKYEELKEQYRPHGWITYNGNNVRNPLEPPYKVTCNTYEGDKTL